MIYKNVFHECAMIVIMGLCSFAFGTEPGKLVKEGKPVIHGEFMEVTPFVWDGKAKLLCSKRPFIADHSPESLALTIEDQVTGEFTPEFASCHSLACGFVNEGTIHVYAARQESKDSWFLDIDHFSSNDMLNWTSQPAIEREDGEHLLNSSVCRDDQGFIMAYESDKPVGFCFKFARSTDLNQWTKVPDIAFAGVDRQTYSACPVIRYHKPWYYVIFLKACPPGYVSCLVRSQDLKTWESSPRNPVLTASSDEGINNSDVDLFEWDGKTWLYYATGDQQTFADVRRAAFPGTEKEFFESYFPEGVPTETINASCL